MEAALVYDIGLRARFRGLDRREGMLLPAANAPCGWVEFSPFWDYDPQTSATWLQAALAAANAPWPMPVRASVPVNVTVPAVDARRAREIVLASGGCRTAKVKVAEPGQVLADDLNRVAAVREALGPAGKIRVDANGAWDVATAQSALTALDRAAVGLEYAEQPVAGVEDLAALRRRTHVPLAADESIRRAEDPLLVAKLKAADIVVLKVQPLGGVQACLDLAEQIQLPVVVSSALETEVGLAAGLALAAALPQLEFACGLATSQLLQTGVSQVPLEVVDGALPTGIGQLNPAALGAVTCQEDSQVARWRRRLEAVSAHLTPTARAEVARRWLNVE